jgi:hypothetical protein
MEMDSEHTTCSLRELPPPVVYTLLCVVFSSNLKTFPTSFALLRVAFFMWPFSARAGGDVDHVTPSYECVLRKDMRSKVLRSES